MQQDFIQLKIPISIGGIFGSILSAQILTTEKTLLRIGGILETHENKTDKYTGNSYIIFKGQFLASNLVDNIHFSATRCVLPPVAERYAWAACRQQRASPRFLMDLLLIPSTHSLGYDFKIKPLMAYDPETDVLAELSHRMAEPVEFYDNG